MSVSVLHLSDIHLKHSDENFPKLADALASSIYEYTRESDSVIILVSGDIAFSGKESEYDIARKLLSDTAKKISNEAGIPVDFVLVPGNHDCDFSGENAIREIVIDSVIKDPKKALNKSVLRQCIAVQEKFFEFRNGLTRLTPIYDDELWTSYSYQCSSGSVLFTSINVAWMSRISEVQGELVFPVDSYPEMLDEFDGLRVAILHHPMNWFSQTTYQSFRKMLRSKFDVIMSGHEHIPSTLGVTTDARQKSLYFEAASLNPHEPVKAGYSLLKFNLGLGTVDEYRFELNGATPELVAPGREHSIPKVNSSEAKGLELKAGFIESLLDAGGPFTHSEKNQIFANDIFVYPELEINDDGDRKTIDSQGLIPNAESGSHRLILGDDKSGKTFLLQQYYLRAHDKGLYSLFIKGGDVKGSSDSEFEKVIRKAAEQQYADLASFNKSEKSKRVLFIDDIDRLKSGTKNKYRLLAYVERHFGSIYITGVPDIELSELVDQDAARALARYQTYTLKSFGHRMRHKLIKNWCLCGSIETNRELDQRVDGIETLLNTVIGKNFVPSRPIYLLILMQSCDSNQEGDLESSGFAYYYQYLITKSLKECGVSNAELNEIFNYLSQLAWFFKNETESEIELASMRSFNKIFSEKFTTVDFESRLKLLLKSRILGKSGDSYFFLYPYVYYFFLGKYLSANISDLEVKDLILNCCNSLNSKDCSSTVLFLSHHVNDGWLIDQIAGALKSCFGDIRAMNFDSDVDALNELVDSSADLILSDINVLEAQERQRKAVDHVEEAEDDIVTDTDSAQEVVAQIQHLLKTAEILGQIIKNYYGSLERSKKREYLQDVFDGPLRMLGYVFSHMLEDPSLFLKEIDNTIRDNDNTLSDAQRSKVARKTAFNLIGMICTGIILRTAQFIASDKLKEEILELVGVDSSNAYRLIQAATRLSKPGSLPMSKLTSLSRGLADNMFAFTIFQSLIVYHLHMFHTSDIDKQKLCSIAKITLSGARSIDVKKGSGKMLPRRKK